MVEILEYATDRLADLLPWPAADAHKYSRGKLVAVAGSASYPGAACLAALAAQRMGAGYVEVACAPESVQVVRGCRPSLVVRSWDGWKPEKGLKDANSKYPCACLIGSGFEAQGRKEQQLVGEVLRDVAAPVLVDGAAIASLATPMGLALARRRAQRGWPLVVTPHAGEAVRMEKVVGESSAEGVAVEGEAANGSAEHAAKLAQVYQCVVVLKGSDTYISNGQRTVIMRQGTAALAKAGTGDVLAGMVGALLAQQLDPLDAAVLGATLHAQAGCVAADELTSICVTPEDVIESISQAIKDLR